MGFPYVGIPSYAVAGVDPNFVGQKSHRLPAGIRTLASERDCPSSGSLNCLRNKQNEECRYQYPADHSRRENLMETVHNSSHAAL
jgi:hypothetical protein